MNNTSFINEHPALFKILQEREKDIIEADYPLWKLKLTDDEYESLKHTLYSHKYKLNYYGLEAALCYAEWWRRDYSGNMPSKEDVASGIGLGQEYSDDLYMAARSSLKRLGYTFIRSLKGTEYFRTLLNQGGLPVNYIKKNEGNMGSFARFLKGLVRELSIINYDWNNEDNSIIQQFNCISYLGKAFKNENIYDVSMQIAHAIIMGDNELLPYDDTDASLSELTKSLEKEYNRAKSERRTKPLSLHWKLKIADDGKGYLFVNMDVVKDISSDSLPGINISTCYSFDVFIAGDFVGTYVRKITNRDEEGIITNVIFTRITVGLAKDILWKGEPVVEVKIRCDNNDRLFLTIAGCYPPNFEQPQLFQLLNDNIYSKSETANAEENIAIFTNSWNCQYAQTIVIANHYLKYIRFKESVELFNESEGEKIVLTNKFTPYTVEFSGNYIPWIEESNFKLLTKVPIIRVYDNEKNKVHNCKIYYRNRNDESASWKKLNTSCVLKPGIIDIKVEFPDGHFAIESFYFIGDLSFNSCNESVYSTEIVCSCPSLLKPEIQIIDNAEIKKVGLLHWRILRNKNSMTCPSVCYFRIYNENNPILKIAIAIPFDGTMITDVTGKIVPKGKIISFADLPHFCIISHGNKNRKIDVSYSSDRLGTLDKMKHLQNNVIEGIVSLADYNDLISRMFNLYGANSFDRSSSVILNISGQDIYVRKFVLDTTIKDGKIIVLDDTGDDTTDFSYIGDMYALPVGDDLPTKDFFAVKLIRSEEDDNTFCFPEGFSFDDVIVFSGAEVSRRVVPKYYNRNDVDYDKSERSTRSSDQNKAWYDLLSQENVISGKHWRDVCKAFEICSRYNLPFTTYNGLKAVARSPKFLVNFVIAMWLNEYKEVLSMDIDRFEQEMVIALHWIPSKIWEKSISQFIENLPEPYIAIMISKMGDLKALIQELFNATVSADIAPEFVTYVVNGSIKKGKPFLNSDINNYKMKIKGLSDTNVDLPTINFHLKKSYYPRHDMLISYRVMIESAMCAAENTCDVNGQINLFSPEGKEYARIVNFYRKYFKETYSDIFFRTVKIISNPNN